MTSNTQPLAPEKLRKVVDLGDLPFETTADLEPLDRIIGQDRAVEAVRFGIGIRASGYNIFAVGDEATGKHSLIREFLEKEAAKRPVPDDWCYVNNFAEGQRPKALRVPPGRAVQLRQDVQRLVEEVHAAIRAGFESEEFQTQRHTLEAELKKQPEEQLEQLDEKAKTQGLTLMRTPRGMAFAPMKDGEVLSPEEFEKLPEDRQQELEAAVEQLQEELAAVLRKVPRWEREMNRRVQELSKEMARVAVADPIDALKEKYAELEAVRNHLDSMRDDMIENLASFLQSEDGDDDNAPSFSLPGPLGEDPLARRYGINVLVDHSDTNGAPVVYEDHPTYSNLMGRIERTVLMGAVITDFQMIQPGCFHQANGGYLMLDVRRLLQQPMAWEGVKRTLRSGKVRIESLEQTMSLASTVTLEPEPIPVDVKVALLGDRELLHLLSKVDPDFDELFKVQADFGEDMPFDDGTVTAYARLIAGLGAREELRSLDRGAVSRVIQRGVRMADDQEKLSVEVHDIADLLRESDYWAGEAGHSVIAAEDVQQAVDARIYRSDRIRERMQEYISRNTIVIETTGQEVGQVNGLSVIQAAGFAFGQPSRITARVAVGSGEVVDIEREVDLSGPFHSKGVLILEGFLKARYAQAHPLSLEASLVFEQSYSGVDGDSASSAELYALLSAISDVPLRQSYAVTGSVSQRGEVQAIGGVNEKIEGFFDVCRAKGLTGEQGVLIPEANVKNLMLRQDIVDAVEAGQFSVFPVRSIDEGIALLTGRPAGERQADGSFPADSVNGQVAARLREFAEARRAFNQRDEEDKK